MKGNLDSRPPAPEVLRLRVTGGRLDDALDVSAPFVTEICSILRSREPATGDRRVTRLCSAGEAHRSSDVTTLVRVSDLDPLWCNETLLNRFKCVEGV